MWLIVCCEFVIHVVNAIGVDSVYIHNDKNLPVLQSISECYFL